MKTNLDLFQVLQTVESKLGAYGDVEILVRRAFGGNIAVRVTMRTDKDAHSCEIFLGGDDSEMAFAGLRFEESLQALEDRLWRLK